MLQPALDAGLVTFADEALRFRHPLVRTAIYQAAEIDRRPAAHAALVEVLFDQPDRRAWHRGESGVECDDGVAGELEEMAWLRAGTRFGGFSSRREEVNGQPGALFLDR